MMNRTEAILLKLTLMLTAGIQGIHARITTEDPDGDRGDVPGWVMITLMTAIVVIGLLAVFKNQVFDAVSKAFSSIN